MLLRTVLDLQRSPEKKNSTAVALITEFNFRRFGDQLQEILKLKVSSGAEINCFFTFYHKKNCLLPHQFFNNRAVLQWLLDFCRKPQNLAFLEQGQPGRLRRKVRGTYCPIRNTQPGQ